VNNIKKITRAMKMVAAAKLRRSQEALEVARAFAKSMNEMMPDVDTKKAAATEGERVWCRMACLIFCLLCMLCLSSQD
jgi:F0F1-type ATP synthase gamma subunit